MSKIEPWKTLESEELAKYGYFRMRKDKCELPDGRIMPGYYTIEFADWVNVIPVTKDKKIVLINQYRHSVEQVTIEIPGGSTHPKENEPVEKAARREMEEETGYTSTNLEFVGFQYPNPALLSNKMHTFIAWDAVKTKEQELDPYEDIETFEVTFTELRKLIETGKIPHSIILGSFLLAQKKLNF
ncbi:MAG: NUDIX hydrolase [Bdellovibrionota bacterium]